MKSNGNTISKNTVIIKRLCADHGQETFKNYLPLNQEMVKEIERNVKEIFDDLGGTSLIKSSRDVYIKPNAVGTHAYVHTRPEVIEAAIRYWFDAGARNVYVFENCTQATCTRLVFEMIGYNAVCKRTGAVPVYLDEDNEVEYDFPGKRPTESDPKGYVLGTFRMPRMVHEKLVREKDANLYVSIPKLKTHSMSLEQINGKIHRELFRREI